jgi:hypothetical protein
MPIRLTGTVMRCESIVPIRERAATYLTLCEYTFRPWDFGKITRYAAFCDFTLVYDVLEKFGTHKSGPSEQCF